MCVANTHLHTSTVVDQVFYNFFQKFSKFLGQESHFLTRSGAAHWQERMQCNVLMGGVFVSTNFGLCEFVGKQIESIVKGLLRV